MLQNDLIGVRAYGTVDILWVVNAVCNEFMSSLIPSVKQRILEINPEFPLIATINPENEDSWYPSVINLNSVASRGLAYQTAWITQNYVNKWIIDHL